MTRLIEILIALAIVVALFLLVGLLLPSSRHLQEDVETNRRMSIVYDTINSMRRFDDWNVLPLQDPQMRTELTGPEKGVGAAFEYQSNERKLGTGKWEIVDAVPGKSVTYRLENPQRGGNKTMTYTLQPTGRNNRNVKITSTYNVDYGYDILGRYQGLYVPRSVGDAMKMSLSRLSNMLATVPNVDYSILPVAPTVVQMPVENVLVVEATVERNNETLRRQMLANMQWVRRVMDDNGLEAAGPVRIVTTELGSENYTFDVAQPVRKRGTGPAAGQEAAGEDADSADGEDAGTDGRISVLPLAGADAPELEITVSGDGNPVVLVRTESRRAAVTAFAGHMANLPNVRDSLRAWALTQGYETIDRPFEVWKKGIEAGFTEEGEFDIYWPLK
jgi:type II secretory pathway pseudopilin PulG